MKGRAWKGQAVIAPWPSQKGVGLARAISDDSLTLPKRKGKEKASSDNPLGLRKEKVQGSVSGNDPLALPEGKVLGRASPLALPKRMSLVITLCSTRGSS